MQPPQISSCFFLSNLLTTAGRRRTSGTQGLHLSPRQSRSTLPTVRRTPPSDPMPFYNPEWTNRPASPRPFDVPTFPGTSPSSAPYRIASLRGPHPTFLPSSGSNISVFLNRPVPKINPDNTSTRTCSLEALLGHSINAIAFRTPSRFTRVAMYSILTHRWGRRAGCWRLQDLRISFPSLKARRTNSKGMR
ncbi:hypothetical protein BKA70DRAFT_670272 [Coprinopsis sp. MPI-PUGE-AT-0042]|nr:hypothetical protein BKA70DRAFT_670272 [Coprinopsis sp. MPI-PUGE-AT-0042]